MFLWRQRSILVILFVLMLLTLVPSLHIANAIACNGDCTLYPGNCDTGLSCVGNVCKPPSPTCTGAYPEVTVTNRTTGSFVVTATGVTNATSVVFYVWSSINDQDDLWPTNGVYPGVNQGSGVWNATINLNNHSAGAGTINVHVYKFNCGYQALDSDTWCGTANFEIDQTPPTCTVSGPTTNCRGASATYSVVGSDTNYTEGQVWKAPAGTQSWANICDPASGNCSGSTTFSPSGNYDVVCNAFDSAGNQCSGNPTPQSGWADCGAASRMAVTVTDPPPAVACPNYCGYVGGDVVPNGDCTTTTCPAVPDNAAPNVPNISSTTANCSGSLSFDTTTVLDNGCYGNVQYRFQVKDNAAPVNNWYVDGWSVSNPSYTVASPVVGRVYKAQVLSSDNGASHTNKSAWSSVLVNPVIWNTGVPYCCKATAAALGPLTPSGTCVGPTSPLIQFSWTRDTNASGYVLKVPACFVDQTIIGNATTTYTLSAAEQAACGTGAVPWTIEATYDGGCVNSAVASASFNYDKTAPPIPAPVITITPDGECLGKYKITHSWNTVNNTPVATYGCAALDVNPYWSQASLSPTPTPPGPPGFPQNVFPTNGWGTYTSQTSTSYSPGTTVYTHVRSRDALNNQSDWSGPESTTIPIPSPYPTIHIEGTFQEDVSGTCTAGFTLGEASSLTFSPVLSPNIGATASCTNDTTSYDCNITINNTTGLCVDPNTTITLNASYPGYSGAEWRTTPLGCSGTTTNLAVTVGVPEPSHPLYFKYNGGDGEGGGWFKLSQTSFSSRMSGRTNYLPNAMTAYDASDPGASKYMIIGSAGNTVQYNSVVIGVATAKYSENNWQATGYQNVNDITYTKYINYIKARKDFITITEVPSASSFPTSGIYTTTQDVTLNPTWFDGKNIVLVIQGAGKKAIFTGTDFISTGSLAVLAPVIEIESTVLQVNAILIGQTVSTGSVPNTTPLKIVGNLIDEEANGLTIGRSRTDASKPTLFVVFDPKTYFDVLPYLSTSTYDWRQIQ